MKFKFNSNNLKKKKMKVEEQIVEALIKKDEENEKWLKDVTFDLIFSIFVAVSCSFFSGFAVSVFFFVICF